MLSEQPSQAIISLTREADRLTLPNSSRATHHKATKEEVSLLTSSSTATVRRLSNNLIRVMALLLPSNMDMALHLLLVRQAAPDAGKPASSASGLVGTTSASRLFGEPPWAVVTILEGTEFLMQGAMETILMVDSTAVAMVAMAAMASGMLMGAAGGLAVGAIGGALVANALSDSDDEQHHHHYYGAPAPQAGYGGYQDPSMPPAVLPPTDVDGSSVSSSDREEVEEARAEYEEALRNAADSDASSSDLEELEEAREEYEEIYEEVYED
ncbi:unnamed protein product [Parascedosporium putredinis]|uniref:Uncharacterized protein n=1 Tax=Parascedosporium putredinis TaxID=1442378 RepID=A0A9P1GXU6_9PEZI|nr:unnamed protein product [Parascedosporium putredinis]CAI7989539.1 unnamed protein product [Parascedosporium putredinis]